MYLYKRIQKIDDKIQAEEGVLREEKNHRKDWGGNRENIQVKGKLGASLVLNSLV